MRIAIKKLHASKTHKQQQLHLNSQSKEKKTHKQKKMEQEENTHKKSIKRKQCSEQQTFESQKLSSEKEISFSYTHKGRTYNKGMDEERVQHNPIEQKQLLFFILSLNVCTL